MTQEEKARAYDEALEKAREELKQDLHESGVWAIKRIFPELAESEDERIRKGIIEIIKAVSGPDCDVYLDEKKQEKYLAWLEKQKENPKNADSISADCVSDVRCENRWYKTANSLPDTGRDVLAKDAIGNYLLASFDGAQWFVSVYDGEDHPVLHTPPILEWCDIPLCQHDINEIYRKGVRAGIEIANCNEQTEQKPVEWSEEDKKMLQSIICEVIDEGMNPTKEQVNWLKSIRPSWKPSDEQMEALLWCTAHLGGADHRVLAELYEHLKMYCL